MKEKQPTKFPEFEKKRVKPAVWIVALICLSMGILIGSCVVIGSVFVIFRGDTVLAPEVSPPLSPTLVPFVTQPVQPTRVALWTPEVPDGAGQPRPTMTPFRPVGRDGTLFAGHFYLENFVGETAALEQLSFTDFSSARPIYEENGISIRHPEGADLLVSPVSLDGTLLGLKSTGSDQFTIKFDQPISAIGLHFLINEAFNDESGRCMGEPVRYEVTFKNDVEEMITLSNHGSDFLGISASNAFDQVDIHRSNPGPEACGGFLGSIFAK
ncbi:MAG: hypothetical protein AAF633_24630 [Chloroflexota bacterium]